MLISPLKKSQKITQLTSQCVMCGLCIPSCPSYQVSLDENLSPRGRISLIQALAQKKINYSSNIKSHLDSCLQCMSCQLVCPSQVNYSEIIAYGQEVIFSNRKNKRFSFSIINTLILSNERARSLFIVVVNFLIRTKLMQLIKLFARKTRLKNISLLPSNLISTSLKVNKKNNQSENIPQLIIFSGCANSLFDSHLLQHSYQLLEHLSLTNVLIDKHNCCGGIYKKEGDIKKFNVFKNKIYQQYSEKDTLISLNSSCSASLINSSYLETKSQVVTKDIIAFLANDYFQALKQIQMVPLSAKVYFHQSCSMKNQLKTQSDCLKLINLIPDIEIKIYSQSSCCGASGNFMLTHADLAAQIAIPTVNFIIGQNIHLMLSTDISCSLHIKQQLAEQNYQLEVLHPVSLLYRQVLIKEV